MLCRAKPVMDGWIQIIYYGIYGGDEVASSMGIILFIMAYMRRRSRLIDGNIIIYGIYGGDEVASSMGVLFINGICGRRRSRLIDRVTFDSIPVLIGILINIIKLLITTVISIYYINNNCNINILDIPVGVKMLIIKCFFYRGLNECFYKNIFV